jgi:deoxyuridine 5'-triphosphate nucleotidohydrolase
LPQPEPPPDLTQDWAEHIYDSVTTSNDNDKTNSTYKPIVAKLVFDNDEKCYSTLDHINDLVDNIPIIHNINNDIDLSSLDDMSLDHAHSNESSTPLQQAIKTVIDDSTWTPNLNTIIEETTYDIANIDNHIHLPTVKYVNRKRTQARNKRLHNQQHQHMSKISQAIDKNGIYRVHIQHAQNDGGANRSVTSCKDLLVHYETIADYGINGVKEGEAAIVCTGRGYLPWRADSGEIILIRCLYCADVSGTIISPSDVNSQYSHRYGGWTMATDHDSKTGKFRLIARDGINHLSFTSYSENNLWYHYLDQVTASEYKALGSSTKAMIKTLSNAANYELWHNRLGHPGERIMQEVHKHVTGVPKLKRNKFYSCSACISAKFRKQHIGKKRTLVKVPTDTKPCEVGQHLHADFGFVRGSDWSKKDNDGKLVTSMDGYRSYCLVIDRASRYIWIVLTKRKTPPVDALRGLLQNLRSKVNSMYCTMTTDLGGELAGSQQFRDLLHEPKVNYSIKTTGAHCSAQNGLAEKPNQDLARMMRSMLYGAGLGSEYWSYALRHAVYLKNRLPHTALKYVTPFEKINGTPPNLHRLRVFGSQVHFMKGERKKKLDRMDSQGLFMTYKGTDKICYVIDNKTKREHTVSHITFDEAFSSVHPSKQPPMASALQQSGFRQEENTEICELRIKQLDPTAKVPVQASSEAAGWDIYCHETTTILPGQQQKIPTRLALELPPGYHGQLHVRSSLASKFQARIEAGIIDSDYRGEIFILMSNNGNDPLVLNKDHRIAQLIIVQDPNVVLTVTNELSSTERQNGGFGSTGTSKVKLTGPPPSYPARLPSSLSQQSTAAAASLAAVDHEPICNVDLSHDPFADIQKVTLSCRGNHPTRGLILEDCDTWNDRVIIKSCKSGTPAARIKRWRSRLKNSTLLKIDDTTVQNIRQLEQYLSTVSPGTDVILTIGLEEKVAMNDSAGIPMMYYDQLNAVSTHLEQIKNGDINKRINENENSKSNLHPVKQAIKLMETTSDNIIAKLTGILPKSKIRGSKLTRKKLKNGKDWDKWKLSEWKQLDQYYGQKTFGDPCPLPKDANVLNLLWCYDVKTDGRYKARMVCNGKPSNKNTAIFGYTYAKSLDHVGSRIFWATAASKNFVVRGADASNAFAEADAPKIPLYVRVNDQYREWWTEKMKRPPIPPGYVLPVHKALQGHPEAPRAWATLIDMILKTKLNFKPTTHEPCLYHGIFQGKEILFLRQVDDFAVAAETAEIATKIIKEIDNYMKIDIKDLGQLERYNGVDIIQSKYSIKLNNPTYLRKIIQEHQWMIDETKISNIPIPMADDRKHIENIEKALAPANAKERIQLQLRMNFNYRQAIGELIYAMVTCRPDISFPLIKLSQYSQNPAEIHYKAVIQIFRYLHATIDDGLIYWRTQPNQYLPLVPLPTVHKSTYTTMNTSEVDSPHLMHGAVDSDWAGDTKHRKSVSGIILRLAGGTILYKTKYQDTIALSTTEAEFAAACDAGKCILYVRSILDEINLPQERASTLFIDNNGALMMGNAQQPTRRTRHVELKKFALLDWVQHDLMIMKRISTSDNCSDGLTKQTAKQLFYRHFDYILGKCIPQYVTYITTDELIAHKANTNETNQATIKMILSDSPCIDTIKENTYVQEHGGDIIHRAIGVNR